MGEERSDERRDEGRDERREERREESGRRVREGEGHNHLQRDQVEVERRRVAQMRQLLFLEAVDDGGARLGAGVASGEREQQMRQPVAVRQ